MRCARGTRALISEHVVHSPASQSSSRPMPPPLSPHNPAHQPTNPAVAPADCVAPLQTRSEFNSENVKASTSTAQITRQRVDRPAAGARFGVIPATIAPLRLAPPVARSTTDLTAPTASMPPHQHLLSVHNMLRYPFRVLCWGVFDPVWHAVGREVAMVLLTERKLSHVMKGRREGSASQPSSGLSLFRAAPRLTHPEIGPERPRRGCFCG
jgi:hypothetical protein